MSASVWRQPDAETPDRLRLAKLRLYIDEATGKLLWRHGHPASPALGGTEAGTLISGGYRQVTIGGERILAGRIAFALANGRWPRGIVETIDGNPTNLRAENLRESTASLVQLKCKARRGRLLPKGVTSRRGRYEASIRLGRVRFYLGSFPTPEAAKAAYDRKNKALRGITSTTG